MAIPHGRPVRAAARWGSSTDHRITGTLVDYVTGGRGCACTCRAQCLLGQPGRCSDAGRGVLFLEASIPHLSSHRQTRRLRSHALAGRYAGHSTSSRRPSGSRARWNAAQVVSLDLRADSAGLPSPPRSRFQGRPIGEGIPVTYVPARNTVLLALASGTPRPRRRRLLHASCHRLFRLPDCAPRSWRPREAANVRDRSRGRGPRDVPGACASAEVNKSQIVQTGVAGVPYA